VGGTRGCKIAPTPAPVGSETRGWPEPAPELPSLRVLRGVWGEGKTWRGKKGHQRRPTPWRGMERGALWGAVPPGWREWGGVVPGRQRHQPGIDVSGWHGATPLSVTNARQGRAGGWQVGPDTTMVSARQTEFKPVLMGQINSNLFKLWPMKKGYSRGLKNWNKIWISMIWWGDNFPHRNFCRFELDFELKFRQALGLNLKEIWWIFFLGSQIFMKLGSRSSVCT
jgi:hypothetical protein